MLDLHQIASAYTDRRKASHSNNLEVIPGQVILIVDYLSEQQATEYQASLMQEINWQTEQIRLYGKTHLVPRLMAWHGDEGAAYRYSGVDHEPRPWNQTLADLRNALFSEFQLNFNSVLLNLYRDGKDSMGWHSDDEPELGMQPVIASISLGQARKLRFRKKINRRETVDVSLPHGSLLLMYGNCQHEWQHHLPKTAKQIKPRINLTFREIKTSQYCRQNYY